MLKFLCLRSISLPIFELPFVVVQLDTSRMLHAPHDIHNIVLVDQHDFKVLIQYTSQ